QVGGSIGYGGSYTVPAPSGASPQQVVPAQQTVAEDRQTLSADERAESDASSADDQAIAAARTSVKTASATLRSDMAQKVKDCAGKGASTAACSQDAQKVTQDRTQLKQARQQLAAAALAATRDRHQNQAKLAFDQTKLRGDQKTLRLLQATAVNPGTTYTWLPKAGEIIKQDRRVYSLNNKPVPLLYGSVAAYRAFHVGMSDGADVGELSHDLIALGYGAGLTQSDHYSSATAGAVERWQRALGLPASGEILLGQVVFEPGPIRVMSVTASVGSSVGGGGGAGGSGGGSGGGTVLTATSTTPIVTVALDVSQEYLVKPGDAVSIVLPDGTSRVAGQIETVGNVATCPGGGGVGTGGGGGTANQSPCESSGTGNSSTPTVTVTIRLGRTPTLATLDQAPVNVNITTQRADNVLAVPVNALLALQGGGFGVDVVTGSGSRLVGVTTGLYANTLVQVSGSGITAGTRVEVPSS
ncbi:MAG: peptidoglycan-binding protein, partial [Solirubrobacterales bacterium]|nr:peptidoglycan-binding protein [Solirubrobacterales bacterium]